MKLLKALVEILQDPHNEIQREVGNHGWVREKNDLKGSPEVPMGPAQQKLERIAIIHGWV